MSFVLEIVIVDFLWLEFKKKIIIINYKNKTDTKRKLYSKVVFIFNRVTKTKQQHFRILNELKIIINNL